MFTKMKIPSIKRRFLFRCIDCGKEDKVPDYVVEEFHFDLEENEEVEVVCHFAMVPCDNREKRPSE